MGVSDQTEGDGRGGEWGGGGSGRLHSVFSDWNSQDLVPPQLQSCLGSSVFFDES